MMRGAILSRLLVATVLALPLVRAVGVVRVWRAAVTAP